MTGEVLSNICDKCDISFPDHLPHIRHTLAKIDARQIRWAKKIHEWESILIGLAAAKNQPEDPDKGNPFNREFEECEEYLDQWVCHIYAYIGLHMHWS